MVTESGTGTATVTGTGGSADAAGAATGTGTGGGAGRGPGTETATPAGDATARAPETAAWASRSEGSADPLEASVEEVDGEAGAGPAVHSDSSSRTLNQK